MPFSFLVLANNIITVIEDRILYEEFSVDRVGGLLLGIYVNSIGNSSYMFFPAQIYL